nr:universal stress protein [Hymenolepis microstoma]
MASETTGYPQARVVLIPVDSSPHCERAFNWYIKRAHRIEDKIILVHVIQPKYSSSIGGIVVEHAVTDLSDNVNESIEKGKKILEKYSKQCKKYNFEYTKTLRADANPGNCIIKVADEFNASVVVIASRGMSKARRTILGSCSHYVVHHSGVPVLVVPPAKRSSASFLAEIKEAEMIE